MATVAELQAVLDLKGDKFTAGVRRAQAETERSFGRMRTVAEGVRASFLSIQGVMAGIGVGLFVRSSIQEFREGAVAVAELEQKIRSTGGAAGLTAKELLKMASDIEKLTLVEDDLIIKSESILLTFTKIGKSVFPDALKMAINLQSTFGGDLTSATVQLGKALNDPIEGVSALRRVGVSFTESQMDVIKSLVETGRVAEAQRVILAELKVQVGGTAEAMAEADRNVLKFELGLAKIREAIGGIMMSGVGDWIGKIGEWLSTVAEGINLGEEFESVRKPIIDINLQIEELNKKAKEPIPWWKSLFPMAAASHAAGIRREIDALIRQRDELVAKPEDKKRAGAGDETKWHSGVTSLQPLVEGRSWRELFDSATRVGLRQPKGVQRDRFAESRSAVLGLVDAGEKAGIALKPALDILDRLEEQSVNTGNVISSVLTPSLAGFFEQLTINAKDPHIFKNFADGVVAQLRRILAEALAIWAVFQALNFVSKGKISSIGFDSALKKSAGWGGGGPAELPEGPTTDGFGGTTWTGSSEVININIDGDRVARIVRRKNREQEQKGYVGATY